MTLGITVEAVLGNGNHPDNYSVKDSRSTVIPNTVKLHLTRSFPGVYTQKTDAHRAAKSSHGKQLGWGLALVYISESILIARLTYGLV